MIDQSKELLAERIKAIRKSKGLTLSDVEKACGVTASTISKIEKGSLSPTYASLLRLVKGLGVDMVDIVSETNSNIKTTKTRRSVTYAGEGSEYSIGTHVYRVLCTDLSEKKMTPMLATIKAKSISELKSNGEKKNGFLASHEGEEVLYVVSGQVILYTECYTPLTLNSGDCAYIDSTMGHVCIKGSDEDATIFWVCSDNNSLTEIDSVI